MVTSKPIILYSTNCPKCQVLLAKLKQKNIDFDINTSIDDMEKLGIMSAPVLSINGELLDFKKAIDWVNAKGEQ